MLCTMTNRRMGRPKSDERAYSDTKQFGLMYIRELINADAKNFS